MLLDVCSGKFKRNERENNSSKAHVRVECAKVATPQGGSVLGAWQSARFAMCSHTFRSTPPQSGSRLWLLHSDARLVHAGSSRSPEMGR